jgi:hypothetical protein
MKTSKKLKSPKKAESSMGTAEKNVAGLAHELYKTRCLLYGAISLLVAEAPDVNEPWREGTEEILNIAIERLNMHEEAVEGISKSNN